MKVRRESLKKNMMERLESVSMLIKSASLKKVESDAFCKKTLFEATKKNEQVTSKSSSDKPLLMKRNSLSTISTISTNFSTNSTDTDNTDDIFDSCKVPKHVNIQSTTAHLSNRGKKWCSDFRRTDPRHQILKFFNGIAYEGGIKDMPDEFQPQAVSPVLDPFYKASVFTVWRPTSYTAIRKMMTGEAVGKGLDIKGKSAKTGTLSGFVPFLQINEEKDKKLVRTISRTSKTRIFFESEQARSFVLERLELVLDEMVSAVREAKADLQTDALAEENLTYLRWDMCDPSIQKLDDYAPKSFGLEIPERLFWEGYVVRQDISRPKGSDYDSGRPSEPNFQDMNNESLRKAPRENHPRTVLVQRSADDPMCPQSLLMAYEERNQVLPVVSDFDCFLTGTRGIKFDKPFAPEQQAVMDWSVSQIEEILNEHKGDSWTKQWLDKLKASADSGYYPTCPEFGFADPKSYSIMEAGIKRLQSCSGPVRHGAESFNYCFPQELDEQFLVISDNLSGSSLPWKYVDVNGLQEILLEKIDQGYTFPLNPKWILCDPGWKRIYDKLLSSDMPNVQDSLDVWYSLPTRERIENIHEMRPEGFKCTRKSSSHVNRAVMRLRCYIFIGAFSKHAVIEEESDDSGNYLMANAEQEMKRYMDLRRAKCKLRTSLRKSMLCRGISGVGNIP